MNIFFSTKIEFHTKFLAIDTVQSQFGACQKWKS